MDKAVLGQDITANIIGIVGFSRMAFGATSGLCVLDSGRLAFALLLEYIKEDVIDIDVLPWNEGGRLFWLSVRIVGGN